MTLFATKIHGDPSKITTFNDVTLTFAWPFYVRLLSGLLTLAATVAAIVTLCKNDQRMYEESEDSVLVARDLIRRGDSRRNFLGDSCDESQDEAENGVLL